MISAIVHYIVKYINPKFHEAKHRARRLTD
jgi:hypothetical protein